LSPELLEGGSEIEGPMPHVVYTSIVKAVKEGNLREPFSLEGFRVACPNFGPGTYRAFLHKHCLGNPGGNSELFERVGRGLFRCLRPFRYGL
jgi:hypothetical protein